MNDAADTLSDTLAVADTEEGPWSRTLTMTTKGTYRFKVCGSCCVLRTRLVLWGCCCGTRLSHAT